MSDQTRIMNVVFSAIDDINETLPESRRFSKKPEAVLFDPGGTMDSLGLTIFIVAIEQKIEQEFDLSMSSAGDYKMFDEDSPFRTVQSLVSYIDLLLKNKANA